ncbi:ribonuclease H-like domain-containing protein, partial [Tanacetum coccineum]
MWSCAMKFALRNKSKLGFIDGTCKRKSDDPVLANQWDLCNSVVVTWVLNSVSAELYASQIYSKTAFDMWTDLKDTYDKFLMGLDDVYQPIRSNILTREPLPLVKTAFAVISGEESHRNVTSMGSTSKSSS